MSEVKRLPDAAGHWWIEGVSNPVLFQDFPGLGLQRLTSDGKWVPPLPGRYVACPCPDWPPKPPPRPKMVFAMTKIPRDRKIGPCWWVRVDFGWRQLHDDLIRAYNELIPHDHPEQSAEESRRILAENNS